ncbi:MAG: hypothetical protein V1914_01155 [archaeon]
MRNTIYALTLATAGILGSCNSAPSTYTIARCNENLKESKAYAKTYKLEETEKRLESIDCSTDRSGNWAINVIMKSGLSAHCEKLYTESWNLIQKDSFKELILQRQGFCLGHTGKLKMDIRELQTLVNNYHGAKE